MDSKEKKESLVDLYIEFLRKEKRWYLNEPLLLLIKECSLIESNDGQIFLGYKPFYEESVFYKHWFLFKFEGEKDFDYVYIFLLRNFRGLVLIENEYDNFLNFLKTKEVKNV